MPNVTIKMFEGRTLEQKREMVKSVTEAICNSINVEKERVSIHILEMKKEDFSRGGVLKSDQEAK